MCLIIARLSTRHLSPKRPVTSPDDGAMLRNFCAINSLRWRQVRTVVNMAVSAFAFVWACLILGVKGEDVLVTVNEGTLRGATDVTVTGTPYKKFLGVPYGKPPVGVLRFAEPLPVESWSGVKDALRDTERCPQPANGYWEPGNVVGSEDCLYLNVFAPCQASASDLLPVMLWIPGGAFRSGSANSSLYGPDFLVDEGVVVVSVTYRVGALGFLSLQDSDVPGNNGLKDQLLAMRWVQANVDKFGGDPRQVTIFAESAGSVSTSNHLFSQSAEGMFSRAILQSGVAVARWPWDRDARARAFRLGAALGVETTNATQLLAFLRQVSFQDLQVDDTRVLTAEEKRGLSQLSWLPVIESPHEGAVITEDTVQRVKDGRIMKVPIITGVTSGECYTSLKLSNIFNRPEMLQDLNDHFDEVVGRDVHLPTVDQQLDAARKMKSFYFGGKNISAETGKQLVDMMTDMYFAEPHDTFVNAVANTPEAPPVYYYEFVYESPNMPNTTYGVDHTEELPFLFITADHAQDLDSNSVDGKVRSQMVRLWTNFAKYGDPTPPENQVLPQRWEPYDPSRRNYLKMDADFVNDVDKDSERMAFWRENIPF